jgi:hypothetical protein
MTGAPVPSSTSVAQGSNVTVTLSLGSEVEKVTYRLANADDGSFSQGGNQVSTSGVTSVDVVVNVGGSPIGSSYYLEIMVDTGSCCGGVAYLAPDSTASTYQRHECDNVAAPNFTYSCSEEENVLDTILAIPWITITP